MALVDLEDGRPCAGLAHPPHHVELAAEARLEAADAAVGHPLHGAAAEASHRADDPGELVLTGIRPGHRDAATRAVPFQPVGREAERASLDGLGDERPMRAISSSRGGLFGRAALAHHVAAQRAVRNLGADVDGPRDAVEHVEVFGERLPAPGDPLAQRGAGDVLDAFHELDEPVALVLGDRGEADPAVAHDDGRDAVQRRGFQHRIPGGLTVVMAMDVDESGGDDPAVGLDDLGAVTDRARCPDRGDAPVVDGDISPLGRGARPVHDRAAADHQIVHGYSSAG